MAYDIKDISLWESGETKIRWVMGNMPLLCGILEDNRAQQPLAGMRIALSVHLEAKTAFLCRVLAGLGAEMYVTGSNPLSTQDDVAAALAHGGMNVFAAHGCTDEEYVEIASTTTVQVDLIKSWQIAWPRLENDKFIMTIGSTRPMEDAAREGDFFCTVTGNRSVITEKHFPLMKDGAILTNAGHFDVEVDMDALREYAVDSWDARANIKGYKLPNGKSVYVIAEGRLVNICAGDGHPAEIMDMSFAIQALSALYLVKNRGLIAEKLIKVPHEIDTEVARRKLAYWGCRIDELTPEQKDYLAAWRH